MENFNSHFNTLYMEISPQSASFSAHNRFYGIIKTPGNLNEEQEDQSWCDRGTLDGTRLTRSLVSVLKSPEPTF